MLASSKNHAEQEKSGSKLSYQVFQTACYFGKHGNRCSDLVEAKGDQDLSTWHYFRRLTLQILHSDQGNPRSQTAWNTFNYFRLRSNNFHAFSIENSDLLRGERGLHFPEISSNRREHLMSWNRTEISTRWVRLHDREQEFHHGQKKIQRPFFPDRTYMTFQWKIFESQRDDGDTETLYWWSVQRKINHGLLSRTAPTVYTVTASSLDSAWTRSWPQAGSGLQVLPGYSSHITVADDVLSSKIFLV